MTAPKEWRGRFYEDFEVGDVYRSRFGRTITDTDNIWFTCLTMNTNPIHFNVPYSERTQFGRACHQSLLSEPGRRAQRRQAADLHLEPARLARHRYS